jgi:hypothetical protein
MAPDGPSASEARRDPPRRGGRRSGWLHLATSLMALTASTQTLRRGVHRGRGQQARRRRERAAGGGSGAAPRRLQSLIILGGRALDAQVSLAARRGQGLTLAVAEVGRTAPEQQGDRNAAVEAVDRSGAAPESVGIKRATPEQGSSGRPVKMSRVPRFKFLFSEPSS